MTTQETLNASNEQFWTDLCGSQMAREVGVTEITAESLQRYDDAYLSFYPYLTDHVPPEALRGKKVLEIGLGYGTLGTRLMKAGAEYTGVDISPGPIEMMQYRMEAYGLSGELHQGDFLSMDLAGQTFDAVVSIGCLHHTGSLEQGINRVHSVLNPGGLAMVMVYNAFSYRHWIEHPLKTLGHGLSEMISPPTPSESDTLRTMYDSDSDGAGCPFTEFSSIKRLEQLFSDFSSFSCTKENCADGKIANFKFADRKTLLPILGRALGIDLYCQATK